MYERKEPDWRWTAELEWWWAWADEHWGDVPDDHDEWCRYTDAYRQFWRDVFVLGLAEDEDDLDDLLDRAWGDT